MDEFTLDGNLLEYEMKRRGITINEMCKELGISKSAFYRKRNGQSEFVLSEIQRIVSILQLESPMPIFFSQKVS